MKPERVSIDYLRDVLDNLDKAMRIVEGMDGDEFMRDEKTVFAVIRALEVVGEAAKKISDELKVKYPEIPWREMMGMRDKLIRDYFGVNL